MIGCILISGCGAVPSTTAGETTVVTTPVEPATATTGVGTVMTSSATTSTATVEAGTTITATASLGATSETMQTTATAGQTGTVQPEDKLSSRLKILSDPSVSSQDPAAQAKAVGLPASGRGSLRRNAQGEILVVIRSNDTSAATIDMLRTAGATIVNVSGTYRTVTAYVRPDHLRAVAMVPAVENISEQLSP